MTVTRDPASLPAVGASIRIAIPDGVVRRPFRVVGVAVVEEEDDGDTCPPPPIYEVSGLAVETGKPVVEYLTSGDDWFAV